MSIWDERCTARDYFCGSEPPHAVRPTIHRQVLGGSKSGGTFLLEACSLQQLRHGTGGPKEVDLPATRAELRRDLEGMEILHAAERERMFQEGRGHAEMSSVLHVVSRRPA